MRTMRALIFILSLFVTQSLYGQNQYSYLEKTEENLDYCGKLKTVVNLIGQKAKIWHNGGIYSTLNGSDNIEWPNEEMKKIAGKEYWNEFEPQIGDIGEIVFVSKSKYKEIIYLLKVKEYYVPIKCSYVVSPTSFDVNEAEQKRWDEIEAYGNGDCNFKKFGFNETWNRAGIFKIDKMSEAYACGLKSNGIDTLMLVKRISDNGSSPNEKQYVVWKDKGNGYLKEFENNEGHNLTESETVNFDWNDLIEFYNSKRVFEEKEMPNSVVSHWTNLIVQLYMAKDYYTFGMQLLCSKEDEKLLNVQFIRKIDEKLN